MSAPSAAQLQEFDRRRATRPVVLFYQYRAPATVREQYLAALVELARGHRGVLRWAGAGEQLLIGPVESYDVAALLHFPAPAEARAFVLGRGHESAVAGLEALQVSVLSDQPRIVGLLTAMAARVAPWLPLDGSIDAGEEPGLGTSTMPTAAALAELRGHPKQDRPVVMINWLAFRDEARYDPPRAPSSGAAAYRRYGRTALLAVHGLGGKVLFLGRHRQQLIGAGGEPQAGRWHEFVLVQYPGRAAFARMTSLRRYRRALVHRAAGLAEQGQGLVVAQPQAEHVWRR